ncbi:MAG: sulfatase-like hydrolase/transferase [Pseudomonadota bacterium]
MTAQNLVIVMSDEHDPRFMGCAGHRARTPHMDAMAAEGLRFTAAYTPSPICVPARAAFATGRRVHQTRCWDNAMPYHGQMDGWGHALQRAGRRVESIGKLHYRAEEDPAGFDVEHIPMHVLGGHGMVWASIRNPLVSQAERPRPRMLGDYVGPGESAYTDYDRRVADRAVAWLEEAAADRRPFVLYVGFVAPHFPLVCPQAFYELYDPDALPEPKLRPADGHARHPWIDEHSGFMDTENQFRDSAERRAAVAAYHGLVSWLDHNLGRVRAALQTTGLSASTRLIYASDHGDNVGARGLWGKSNMYEESARVPLMICGPDVPQGECATPVDLLDLHPTLLRAAGVEAEGDGRPGRDLMAIAAAPFDAARAIFSEYHAAGSNSAAYMIRKGRWKLIEYVGHAPELFDLDADPEETLSRAADPDCAATLAELRADLAAICDPEATDAAAKADQAALIERHGGRAAAARMGAPGATPPPSAAGGG